jgi:predicted  nucleic acid-binding Zn-ribbon protein
MSEELQKEIDRLKAENAKLARDLTASHEDLKEVRGEARDRRHESKTLKDQLEALTKERDEFKTRSEADPEGLRAQVSDLAEKLREVHHRAAFTKVAQDLKVSDPNRIADLYALSGYKPETDQAENSKLAEVIQAALKGRPHFLDGPPSGGGTPAAGAAGATTAGQGGKPGPGSERGQSVSSTSSSTARDRIPGRL